MTNTNTNTKTKTKTKKTNDHAGAATVRIRHMEVPDAVRAGTEVALNCDYDLQVTHKNIFISLA